MNPLKNLIQPINFDLITHQIAHRLGYPDNSIRRDGQYSVSVQLGSYTMQSV